jgi:hypothetical protein
MTFEKVREAALKIPDVEECSAYGLRGFKVRKKLFLVFREKLGAAVFRATFEQRDAMMAEDPETFFTNDHYRNYPWVMGRVTKLRAPVLSGLLQMALKYAMAEPAKKAKTKRSKPSRE